MPFLCELSPGLAKYESELYGDFPLLGGELALPIRVARVSRFDRQLRYYSEELPVASDTLGPGSNQECTRGAADTGGGNRLAGPETQNAAPRRSSVLGSALPLASRKIWPALGSPYLSGFPGRFCPSLGEGRFLAVALAGVPVFLAAVFAAAGTSLAPSK